jgi:predicted transcriptional regulator
LYATKPVGKIVGEFLIDEVLHNDPKSLWDVTHSSAGISKEYFDDYFSGKSSGYAIKVKSPKRYKKNLDIREIHKSAIAPQSFAYVP